MLTNKQRRHYLIALTLLLLIASVRPASAAPTGLSGTKYIGGPFADYPSISAAVSILNVQGVSGDLTFRISPNLYDEQITLIDFPRDPGAETATVTFKADISGSPPTWQYSAASAASNWVIKLDNADYITFDNILFESAAPAPHGRIIVLDNEVEHATIQNSTFTGYTLASSDDGSLIYDLESDVFDDHQHLSILNNSFIGGYRAIDITAFGNTGRADDTTISDNSFQFQYEGAIYLAGNRSTVSNNSTISSATFANSSYTAMFLSVSSGTVTGNEINVVKGKIGLEVVGSTSTHAIVANNMIAIHDLVNSRTGIQPRFGVDLYHNTVWVDADTDASALYIITSTNSEIQAYNNQFINAGGGPAIDMQVDGALEKSDYNNLYTTGATLVSWLTDDYATLNDFQVSQVFLRWDQNSVSKSVSFASTVSPPDLHLASPSNDDPDFLAPQIADIMTDIDGDARSPYQVYMGADEGNVILPLDNADAGGHYIVGTTPGDDFPDVNSAIDDLNSRGIKGDVTFRIRFGTYDNTHRALNFLRYDGALTTTVRFTAFNNLFMPTLQYGASDHDQNYAIWVDDMNDVTFNALEFKATGSDIYNGLIRVTGENADRIKITNSVFIGNNEFAETFQSDGALVYFYADNSGSGTEQTIIRNNRFENAMFGAYLHTGSAGGSGHENDTLIENNSFSNQSVSAISSDHDLLVRNNTIVSSQDHFVGIDLNGSAGTAFEEYELLVGNTVFANGDNVKAVYLDLVRGDVVFPAIIKNNMFSGKHTALELANSTGRLRIFHNTLRAQAYVLHAPDALGGLTIYNNILVSPAAVPVLEIGEDVGTVVADYNNLQNGAPPGSNLVPLVVWRTDSFGDLPSYRAATGQGINSVRQAVSFAAAGMGDLHLAGASDGDSVLGGMALAEVTEDIDGEVRSLAVPYMGADEATPLSAPTAVVVSEQLVVNNVLAAVFLSLLALLMGVTGGVIRAGVSCYRTTGMEAHPRAVLEPTSTHFYCQPTWLVQHHVVPTGSLSMCGHYPARDAPGR